MAVGTFGRGIFEICQCARFRMTACTIQCRVDVNQDKTCLAVIKFFVDGFLAIMAGKTVGPIFLSMGSHEGCVDFAVACCTIADFK